MCLGLSVARIDGAGSCRRGWVGKGVPNPGPARPPDAMRSSKEYLWQHVPRPRAPVHGAGLVRAGFFSMLADLEDQAPVPPGKYILLGVGLSAWAGPVSSA